MRLKTINNSHNISTTYYIAQTSKVQKNKVHQAKQGT